MMAHMLTQCFCPECGTELNAPKLRPGMSLTDPSKVACPNPKCRWVGLALFIISQDLLWPPREGADG